MSANQQEAMNQPAPISCGLACRYDGVRDVWPTDRGPAAKVCSSVEIGIGLITAGCTPKDRLRRAIRFIDMMTLRTFTAGVARIHDDDWDAHKTSLVFDELPELSECPRMQNCTLLPPSRDPGADVSQFFNCDSPASALSLGNDLLGNYMVSVGRETPLTPGKIAEFASSTASTFLLEFSPESSMAITDALDRATVEVVTIRSRSDLGNAEVYPKPFIHDRQRRLFHVTGNAEIPFAAMADQVRFALAVLEKFGLARPSNKWNDLPPVESPDADSSVLTETQDAVIVGDSPSWGELALTLLVQLVGISNLGKYADCELGTELELISCGMVKRLLESEVGEHFPLPCLTAKPIGAFVHPIHGRQQREALICGRKQFDFSCDLQYLSIP